MLGAALILMCVLGSIAILALFVYLFAKGSSAPPTQAPPRGGRRLRDGPDPRFANRIDVGCEGERCWFDIVGESSYQGALRRIAGDRLLNEEEVFVRCVVASEPDNPSDPNAVAVYAEGFGKVGYFSRDDLAGTYGLLRERLIAEGAVGTCIGRLTGGWEEDIHIGVRLALMLPSTLRGEPSREKRRLDAPEGWEGRLRVPLPIGKAWINLIDERLCQENLQRLAGDRDVARETVAFNAVLVPGLGEATVCALDDDDKEVGAVGCLGRSDVARYSDVLVALDGMGAVGLCSGWVISERDILGARITLKSPKALAAELMRPRV